MKGSLKSKTTNIKLNVSLVKWIKYCIEMSKKWEYVLLTYNIKINNTLIFEYNIMPIFMFLCSSRVRLKFVFPVLHFSAVDLG